MKFLRGSQNKLDETSAKCCDARASCAVGARCVVAMRGGLVAGARRCTGCGLFAMCAVIDARAVRCARAGCICAVRCSGRSGALHGMRCRRGELVTVAGAGDAIL